MDYVGLGLYFEDLPLGRKFRTVGRTVTDTDITTFINCIGMTEVLFTNVEFIEKEMGFKARLAPGILCYSFAEGLLVQSMMQGTGLAMLRVELDIKNPVFSGDTIHVEVEVIEARRTSKKPDRGLVKTRNHIVKQDGTIAIVYEPLRMVKARTKGETEAK